MRLDFSLNYDGLLPDIILLTQCYYHRGTRSNAMKEVLYDLQPLILLKAAVNTV